MYQPKNQSSKCIIEHKEYDLSGSISFLPDKISEESEDSWELNVT